MLRASRNGDGYWTIHLDDKNNTHLLHRLLAIAFLPNPKGKPFVNHKDLNTANSVLSNLEWVTREENDYHAKLNGAYPSGENHANAKWTEVEIAGALRKVVGGMSLGAAAATIGMGRSYLWQIKSGRARLAAAG